MTPMHIGPAHPNTSLIVRNYHMTHANHNDIFNNQDEHVPVGMYVCMRSQDADDRSECDKEEHHDEAAAHMPDALQEGSGHTVALPHLKCEMGGIVLVYSL